MFSAIYNRLTDLMWSLRIKMLPYTLGVERKAAKMAEAGRPASSAVRTDPAERGIAQAVVECHRKLTKHYHRKLEPIVDAWNARTMAAPIGDVAGEALQDVERDNRVDVTEARVTVSNAARELVNFEVDREPVHYEGQWKKVAVIFLLGIAESALNAKMFAVGESGGLLGGWLVAIFVSACSIVISALAGNVLRWWNGRAWQRTVAGLVGAIYLPLIIAFHLGVGHFKTGLAQGLGQQEASLRVMQCLITTPFDLDLHGYFLALIGLAMALLALVEGFKLDDPVPGFGAAKRRLDKSLERMRAFEDEMRDDLGETLDSATGELDGRLEQAQAAVLGFESALRKAIDMRRDYLHRTRMLAEMEEDLITTYRDINAAQRADDPPAYFTDPVDVSVAADPDLMTEFGKFDTAWGAFDADAALRALQDEVSATDGRIKDDAGLRFDDATAVNDAVKLEWIKRHPGEPSGFLKKRG